MGWRRSVQYFWFRLRRLTATPHAIALGVSFGVFASFTPFMGLHLVLALGLAYLFGGSLLAATLGTAAGNPLTFPLIWMAGYGVGDFLLGTVGAIERDVGHLFGRVDVSEPFLFVLTVGSVPLGVLTATMCYFPVRILVAGFQASRRQRLLGIRETRPGRS